MHVYGEITGKLSGAGTLTGSLSRPEIISGTLSKSETISGSLGGSEVLFGSLSGPGGLSGSLTVPSSTGVGEYEGPYEVTPQAYEEQILETAHKYLTQDVTVHEVPYYVTSNPLGETVYIASEVN